LAALLAKLFSISLPSSLIFRESYKQRMQRSAEIENWSSNIYRLALSNIVSPEDDDFRVRIFQLDVEGNWCCKRSFENELRKCDYSMVLC